MPCNMYNHFVVFRLVCYFGRPVLPLVQPAEDEDSEDDADEVLQRMAALERQRCAHK